MEKIVLIIISAIVIEAIVEVFKNLVVKELPTALKRAIAIALGLLFAYNFNLDLLTIFNLVGRTSFIGVAATGLLIGGGSSALYDTLKQLGQVEEDYKSKEE